MANSSTIIIGKALRHKNMPPKVVATPPQDSPSTDTPTVDPTPGNTDTPTVNPATQDPTMVSMEFLKDEDDQVFMPRTHTKAVQNSRGEVLDDLLDGYSTRIAALEQGLAPQLRIADNLITTSGTVALSAKQGKVLNDRFNDIFNSTTGDVIYSNGKLILQDNCIDSNHLSPNCITNDAIEVGTIEGSSIAEATIEGANIAEATITQSNLTTELSDKINAITEITDWQETVDETLAAYNTRITALESSHALLLEQNQFLLNEHQKMKHLDIVASIYNATTGTDVQGSISWNDCRLSGLQVNYKWRFWDEIDGKDYTPVAFKIEALIHQPVLDDTNTPVLDEDGEQVYEDTTAVISTDKGMNNLQQALRLRALNAGSTVTIRTTVNYCWLDWIKNYIINITD